MRSSLFPLALLLPVVLGSVLSAQRPVFRPTASQETRHSWTFSGRVLFGVDATLSNLGAIDYPAPTAAQDEAGFTEYLFQNGAVIVADGADVTSEFAFSMTSTVDTPIFVADSPTTLDPDRQTVEAFTLARYRTDSLGSTALAEGSGNYGWEVAYNYEFGKRTDRIRFGIMAGFAINNLDFEFSDIISATGLVQQIMVNVSGLGIVYREGGVYSGDRLDGPSIVYEPGSATDDVTEFEERETGYIDAGTGLFVPTEAEVGSNFSYDGILGMMRVGPTVSLSVTEDLKMDLSAGVVGVFINSRVTLNQTLLNLPTVNNFSSETAVEESDYLFGIFGEGAVRYQMTDRVGLYSSVMYLKMQELDNTTVGNVDYDLSLETPVFATAGLRLSF